jgi:hypothetical protein
MRASVRSDGSVPLVGLTLLELGDRRHGRPELFVEDAVDEGALRDSRSNGHAVRWIVRGRD